MNRKRREHSLQPTTAASSHRATVAALSFPALLRESLLTPILPWPSSLPPLPSQLPLLLPAFLPGARAAPYFPHDSEVRSVWMQSCVRRLFRPSPLTGRPRARPPTLLPCSLLPSLPPLRRGPPLPPPPQPDNLSFLRFSKRELRRERERERERGREAQRAIGGLSNEGKMG